MAYDQKGAAMFKLAKEGNEAAQRAAYLDYVNNFLTVAGFAGYYGVHPRSAEVYLEWWRDVHESCLEVEEALALDSNWFTVGECHCAEEPAKEVE